MSQDQGGQHVSLASDRHSCNGHSDDRVVEPNCAAAIPLGGLADIPLALERDNPIEKVALCFYLDGWNGPGLYECGYRRRYGEGFIRREREERRERFEDRRERRERFEDRRY
jgi:hypothetical protein